ncbi:hypothetical protein BG015_010610 [Linnemannia schmuckeri]|uniref:CID domain-containing protein n=1 Tax=Linnemannia schmuckeri TaxID=64567 RepID=A0A9P5RU78_9FUNG|nr:hypothetical protein BG015_010610 [Linnemannia schmuckeri]
MYQQQYQQPPAQQQRQQQQHGGGQDREPIDPFQARQLYRNELASLTFNSKPIITSLTISAGENASVSKVIVQTIEERLRTAPANQKLPTLYLIDSIIKNVGGPYLNLFARTIVTLFLDAYAVVDSSAKASFEKVLGTWPNWTSQLFPKELITKIEQGVRAMRQQKQGSYQPSSSHGKPHYSDRPREDPYSQNASNMYGNSGSQNRPTPPPAPVESSGDNGLLKDIQLLMLQKQHAMIMNPTDQASAKQVGILQQLESLVKTTQLTPESSNIIRQQLAQLWTPAPAPPVLPVFPQGGMPAVSSPMPPNMIPGSMPPLQPPQPPSMPLPPNLPFPPPHFPPQFQPGSTPSPHMMGAPLPMPIPPAGIPMSGGHPMPIPPPSMPMPMPPMPMSTMPIMPTMPTVPTMPNAPAPPTLPGAPAANLFASLMQSGLLGPNGALAKLNRNPQSPMGGTPPPPMPLPLPLTSAPGPAPTPPTLDRADQSEQDRSVMSLGLIELSSQDIQRRRPAAIQVMYGTPPLQCNQCGYRCPKSADAQKKMDSHLDWHFRQNRRMKDKAKKSHSRSWLVGEEDWIHSREGDLSQSQQPVFFDFASGVNKTSKDEQALQEEIAAMKEQIVSEVTLAKGLCGDDTEANINASALIAKGCSICKEKFIKVWNEAEEEWSYKNAVAIDKMIYHATCHADLVRSTARQAAAAAAANAAAATATAESISTSSPSSSTPPTGPELSDTPTTAQMEIKDEDMKEDIKTGLKVESDQQAPEDIKMDHDMHPAAGATDSDLPTSLKRKLEIDNEEQSESASKKSLLSENL